ncbi:RNA-processing protein [Candidatus Woesearchaeota archaeon]|nr:RNA-processing protein [Candidatus Woesearchaeota archaeon]
MANYVYELRIPKDRVAVLIGKNGEVKKELEQETKTSIEVDSTEGDVFVSGDDAIQLFTVREIIKAIGRGFNPELAKLLLKQDYTFEMIPLTDFIKNKGNILRLKGRVIGAQGKSRKTIEALTETHLCVYGKTIAILGLPENVATARRAIESLLSGSPHSSVYRWLEKKRRELKQRPNV